FQEHTLVGCPNDVTKPDIQLQGLGIQPEHCVVDITENEVFVTPVEGARTCVNGSVIHQCTKVKHGDRILWGNNHFFRINTPIQNSPTTSNPEDADQTIDYKFAQQELMMKEFSNDPISEAICAVEKQYEEDKQVALEQQRQMYERQMQQLRYQLMSPGTPSMPFPPVMTPTGVQSGIQRKYQQWAQERDKMFKHSLSMLREEVVKANSLVREANFLAEEMGKQTEFHVTLQIPASNLSPNRRRGALVCEPAILVRRKHRGSQVWSMEKFENKIIDMRDMYEDRKSQGIPLRVDDSDESESDDGPPQKGDPFYESYENHNLIGVANVFLDCLFYDVKLDYQVPIISQQGEVAGKLHMEISKLGTAMMDRYADINDDSDDEEGNEEDADRSMSVGAPLIIRVKICEAKGLPKDLSNFVFCQYSFWGHDEPISVPPEINPDTSKDKRDSKCIKFNHERDFKVYMSEEFIEYAQEGALFIEVWGHKVVGFGQSNSQIDSVARSNSLVDRWHEVTRKIEVWVEIHEVNDQGEYAPVEVKPQSDVPSAGVFQLRQGHARRILTRIKSRADSGTLPLICDSVSSLAIGCICARSKLQKGLDSYQEEDLGHLRDRWNEALSRRHKYLDSQIQSLINKTDKTEADCDRERALIDQWVSLTEERNAVMVPAAGSEIPGAPADWEAPPDMEQHRPVLFLDLNSDDMTTPNAKEGTQAAGINSILPKEQSNNYMALPILKAYTETDNVCAIASWDSSIHDSANLNRITGADNRVYLILKIVLRLSHPAYMEVVLRKRICVNIKHRNMSLTDKLKKKMWMGGESLHASGVTFDVVSNIPKASEDLEHMESLAQMAASQNEVSAADGETYIEKYIKGVSAVESILTLDRLRQEVAVKELMAKQGQSLRKTTSVPNIHQLMTTPPRLEERMRFESIQDLSMHDTSLRTGTAATWMSECVNATGSSRPSFLDLKLPSLNVTPKSALSPLASKLSVGMKPLQTLREEQQREHKPLLDTDQSADNVDSENIGENGKVNLISHSGTCDSIAESHGKGYTPSMTSSGYGSQAVSTLTLSSEDSLSLRSNDDSDLHRMSRRPGIEHCSSGDSDGDDSAQGHSSAIRSEVIEEIEGQVHDLNLCSSNETLENLNVDTNSVEDVTQSKNDGKLKVNDSENTDKISLKSDLTENEDDDDEEEKESVQLHISEEDLSSTGKDEYVVEKERNLSQDNVQCKNDNSKDDQVVNNNADDANCDKHESENQSHGRNSSRSTKGSDSSFKCSSRTLYFRQKLKIRVFDTGDRGYEEILQDPTRISGISYIQPSKFPTKGSDSSSNASRGPLYSDSVDPYSLEAMEELEKLGDEFGPDNSEFVSMNETTDSIKDKSIGKISSSDQTEVKDKQDLDDSFMKSGLKLMPENQSTPIKREKRKAGTRSEPRPVSCIVTSDNDLLDQSLQERSKRNSLDCSDEHLSEDSMSVCSFGSRADLDRLSEVPMPSWIQVGESVMVTTSKLASKMTGVVQFVGNVEFASGPWVGVELDLPEGKNNGSVNGIPYFRCRPRHGIFVRHDKLIMDKKRRGSRKSAANLLNRKSLGHVPGSSPSSKAGTSFTKKK
ncbi:kinesin-like protein KIF13A, partial [Ruditapes philippinarum]|uniref:kinesin-like protein KIF13A n=1 Tax=Ruditapes philippinarum TaxID=129788 RepID=UPI00295B72BD